MDIATDFFNGFKDGMVGGINVCKVGEIIDFDPSRMSASVNIFNKGQGGDYSPLINVPVSFIKAGDFFIRPPYKAKDKVIVVFADSDIDNILISGSKSDSNSTRTHDIADAIIVGSFNSFNVELPSDNIEDLLISNKEGTTKVILKADGDVVIEGKNILLGENASEGVPLGDSLKSWLDNHTHAELNSPPTSSSPGPSEVVKV